MIGEAGRWGIFGDGYEWASTNEILRLQGGGPPHPVFVVHLPTGERMLMPEADAAVNAVFTNDRCEFTFRRGWIVASGRSRNDLAGETLVTQVGSTNARILHGVKLIGLFWSPENTCWIGLGDSPPYGGWLYMQVSSGVVTNIAASFSPKYPLGFSVEGAFLSLNDFFSERTNSDKNSVRLSRWTTDGAGCRESQTKVSLPRSELSGAYLSPRGDKILWCFLEDHDHRTIASHFRAAVVRSCECWISTERATGFKCLGSMNYKGDFLPRWLPDDKRFSFMSDGFLYVSSTDQGQGVKP
jgi:hypothetical protein